MGRFEKADGFAVERIIGTLIVVCRRVITDAALEANTAQLASPQVSCEGSLEECPMASATGRRLLLFVKRVHSNN